MLVYTGLYSFTIYTVYYSSTSLLPLMLWLLVNWGELRWGAEEEEGEEGAWFESQQENKKGMIYGYDMMWCDVVIMVYMKGRREGIQRIKHGLMGLYCITLVYIHYTIMIHITYYILNIALHCYKEGKKETKQQNKRTRKRWTESTKTEERKGGQ